MECGNSGEGTDRDRDSEKKSASRPQRGLVKIRRVPREMQLEDIRNMFEGFGVVRRAAITQARDCLLEFASRREGERAVREKDGHTLSDIAGRNKRSRKYSREFVWDLEMLPRGAIWEDLVEDGTREERRMKMERLIVEQKKKNMLHVEGSLRRIARRSARAREAQAQGAGASSVCARDKEPGGPE